MDGDGLRRGWRLWCHLGTPGALNWHFWGSGIDWLRGDAIKHADCGWGGRSGLPWQRQQSETLLLWHRSGGKLTWCRALILRRQLTIDAMSPQIFFFCTLSDGNETFVYRYWRCSFVPFQTPPDPSRSILVDPCLSFVKNSPAWARGRRQTDAKQCLAKKNHNNSTPPAPSSESICSRSQCSNWLQDGEQWRVSRHRAPDIKNDD